MGQNRQKTDHVHRTIFRGPLPATIWLVALTAPAVAIATAFLALLQPNPNWFYAASFRLRLDFSKLTGMLMVLISILFQNNFCTEIRNRSANMSLCGHLAQPTA